SKKSADLRCASRFSLWVSMVAGSIWMTVLLLVGSFGSWLTVPVTLLNWPCTVLTIMCLMAKPALEGTGSTVSATASAGVARSASNPIRVFIRAPLCRGSGNLGDLPEADQGALVAVRCPEGRHRALRQGAAGEHVVERIEEGATVLAGFRRPGGKAAAGDREELARQLARRSATRAARIERLARHLSLEIEPLGEGPGARQ